MKKTQSEIQLLRKTWFKSNKYNTEQFKNDQLREDRGGKMS